MVKFIKSRGEFGKVRVELWKLRGNVPLGAADKILSNQHRFFGKREILKIDKTGFKRVEIENLNHETHEKRKRFFPAKAPRRKVKRGEEDIKDL